MTVTVLAMVHGKQNELWVSVVAVKGGEKEGGGRLVGSRQSAVGVAARIHYPAELYIYRLSLNKFPWYINKVPHRFEFEAL